MKASQRYCVRIFTFCPSNNTEFGIAYDEKILKDIKEEFPENEMIVFKDKIKNRYLGAQSHWHDVGLIISEEDMLYLTLKLENIDIQKRMIPNDSLMLITFHNGENPVNCSTIYQILKNR